MKLDYQYIDDFLNGRLSERETQQVENHLKTHPLDAEMVANVADALQEGKSVEELVKLEGVFRKNLKEPNKATKPLRWTIAAAIALLMASGLWFFLDSGSSPSELYMAHYEPYEDMLTTRGVDHNVEAMEFYNDGDYAKAETSFSEALNHAEGNKLLLVYYGLSQFENDRKTDALATFEQILSDNAASSYHELGHWYSAMIYLSMDNIEEATRHLQLVKGRSSRYTKKAEDILEAI